MTTPWGIGSFFRGLFASMAFFVATLSASTGETAPTLHTDFPCKGCLFLPPAEGATIAPLLVVLHGDAPGGKTPLVKRDSAPFVEAAIERGIAVLAPMCPKDQGCLVGSFWQWSQGDPPAWIVLQIEAVRKKSSIDPNRIWIAGWSGGASFLGYHYPRLAEHYAAVIFAGGGMPPASKACAPCSPPAYFLVGDKNPLHHLAKGLKENILSCTKDVTWDLLPGKDHAGEWRTLSNKTKAGELLDWLAKHPRRCPDALDKRSTTIAAQSSSSMALPIPGTNAPPTPSPSPPTPSPSESMAPHEPHGSCMMSAPSGSPHHTWWFIAGLFVGFSWYRRIATRPMLRRDDLDEPIQ